MGTVLMRRNCCGRVGGRGASRRFGGRTDLQAEYNPPHSSPGRLGSLLLLREKANELILETLLS
jgi:hypothetical protein